MKQDPSYSEHYAAIFQDRLKLQSALVELEDQDEDLGTRIDLAMALGDCHEVAAEESLLKIASNAFEHASLVDACGESLGEIWSRGGEIPYDKFKELTPSAKKIAEATFAAHNRN